MREGLTVKLVASKDGKETFVLCRSTDRREKEKAMHERFALRIDAALASLSRRIESSTNKLDRGLIERQIGRMLQRNSRAAGRYDIRLTDRADHPSGLNLLVTIKDDWSDWAKLSEGAYVLWKALEQWQSRAGLGNSPRTILTELSRIQSHDVVLPLADGRDLRLRCVVRPDRAQAALLQRLGLELPARLRPSEVREM